jgi:hypothetical protein
MTLMMQYKLDTVSIDMPHNTCPLRAESQLGERFTSATKYRHLRQSTEDELQVYAFIVPSLFSN